MTRNELIKSIIKILKRNKLSEYSNYAEDIILCKTEDKEYQLTTIILNKKTKGFETTIRLEDEYTMLYTHKQIPLPLLYRIHQWFTDNENKLK